MTVTGVLGVIGLVVLVIAAGSYLLPSKVTVVRSLPTNVQANDMLRLASSNQGYQSFNPYKESDPNLKITLFGPGHGVGSGFQFEGKDGKGSQVVAEVTETSVTYAIDLGVMGKPVQKITIHDGPAARTLEWRMEADMGMNPVFRIFGLFMDGMMGPILEQGLQKLNKAVSKTE